MVVPHTNETFLAGIAFYEARMDKGYSLTDCVSMLAMRNEGLTDVLTNDRHFEQEAVNRWISFLQATRHVVERTVSTVSTTMC
jgi:predicted nucleic acid-binding protein